MKMYKFITSGLRILQEVHKKENPTARGKSHNEGKTELGTQTL